jgi:hypothetical protein
MSRKAPSPVPFEGGSECRPDGRAAPALVVEAAILHRHALYHSELIVAAMRELAHQELGMLSPRLQLRCGGAHVGDQRVGFDKRRRRVATLLPFPSVRSAAVAESRERHEPKMRTRVPRPASVQRELEARNASASPTAIQLIGTCQRTVRPCALTTVYCSLTVTSALGQSRRFRIDRRYPFRG